MPYTAEHGWLLLASFAARLERLCKAHCRTRPGLEPEDLAADAVMLFIKRAPAWFAMPAENVTAQAWTLLAFCVRNLVTKYDREILHLSPSPPPGSDPNAEPPEDRRLRAIPIPEPPEDRRLMALKSRIARLGPVHQLLIIAVSVPRWLRDELFEHAAAAKSDPFRGQPSSDIAQTVQSESKKTYVGSTEFEDQVEWKRFLRVTFRIRPPREEGTEDELRKAVTWLDHNLSLARAQLAMASDEEEVD